MFCCQNGFRPAQTCFFYLVVLLFAVLIFFVEMVSTLLKLAGFLFGWLFSYFAVSMFFCWNGLHTARTSWLCDCFVVLFWYCFFCRKGLHRAQTWWMCDCFVVLLFTRCFLSKVFAKSANLVAIFWFGCFIILLFSCYYCQKVVVLFCFVFHVVFSRNGLHPARTR